MPTLDLLYELTMALTTENFCQSGTTAFSKGGVSGPNKLEGLVAFGLLKAGKGALKVEIEGKSLEGDFIADREAGGNGKFVFGDKCFGDILT